MTDEKFTELVNLYLDEEISAEDLAQLKSELAQDASRERDFTERCRLHQAMRLAMSPSTKQQSSSRSRRSGTGGTGSSRRTSRRRSGSASASSGSTRRSSSGRSSNSGNSSHSGSSSRGSRSRGKGRGSVETVDPRLETTSTVAFPPWIMGTGLAACLALGAVLLAPVFRNTTHIASMPELEGVSQDALQAADPLDEISRTELRRYASIQEQRESNRRASLAAQLRLLGLSPEIAPRDKELRSVSLAALQPKTPARTDAQLLEEIQKMRAIPEPQLLEEEWRTTRSDPTPRWPGGFQSSLASFK